MTAKVKEVDPIDQLLQEKASALGLDPDKGEIVKYCTPEGEWIIQITRQGYRKALAGQPDYDRHVVYPIYDNTHITIDGNNVRVEVTGEMSNLMGAMAFLYKRDMDGFFMYQLAISDFEHLLADSRFWKNMPHSAAIRTCEIAVIRMAYPELFGNVYTEDEFVSHKVETRNDIIKEIRTDMEIANGIIEGNVRLESLSTDELKNIRDAVNAKREKK